MRIISIYSSLHFNQYCLSYMSCFLYSLISFLYFFFFFNDPPTPEIYPLSLHDALPIWLPRGRSRRGRRAGAPAGGLPCQGPGGEPRGRRAGGEDHPRRAGAQGSRARLAARLRRRPPRRSEEHTSELQSRLHLVCRLLLE